MVFENKVSLIVMLCNLIEKKLTKCHNYWSDQEKLRNFKLEKKSEQIINDYLVMREFSLTHVKSKEERSLKQLHFVGWPDHGVPNLDDVYDTFQTMIQEVEQNISSPVVVHCSAGVGRTGTFISMYNLHMTIEKSLFLNKQSSVSFNIWNLVRKIKELRIMSVENSLQYRFIYSFMSKTLTKIFKKK
jgi:protein tyrosine phosphatase